MTAKNVIILPANVHIATVSELRDKALLAVQTGKDVTVKAGDSVRVDTAGLQLLLALQSAVQENGKRLKWENASREFRRCIELLGAERMLKIAND